MIRHALLVLLVFCPAQAVADDQPDRTRGLALWSKIHEVFSHPRCANCHVGGDNVPMWSGASNGSVARPHGMNINAGNSRNGTEYLACPTCHTLHNSETPHGPPGAVDWRLPAPERQWFGKSSAEICRQFRDPKLRNIASIDEVIDHIKNDGKVKWGWSPGPGREALPYSAGELAAFVAQWDKSGAPCPDE
jgi:hypothetical protein